jgi:hypothetical protein
MRTGPFIVFIAAAVLLSCGREHDDSASAPESATVLVDHFREGSTADQVETTKRLVAMGSRAVPELIRVARESSDTLQRVRAVGTLGAIGSEAEAALSVLRQIIHEGVPHLSESAKTAYERIRGESPQAPGSVAWEEWWKANRASFSDGPAMR